MLEFLNQFGAFVQVPLLPDVRSAEESKSHNHNIHSLILIHGTLPIVRGCECCMKSVPSNKIMSKKSKLSHADCMALYFMGFYLDSSKNTRIFQVLIPYLHVYNNLHTRVYICACVLIDI